MGAADFTTIALGKTANEAFSAAIEDALYDYGHAGYTGTIAEKGGDGFVQFNVKTRTNPTEVQGKLWDAQVALSYEKDPTSEWVCKPNAAQRNALAWLRDRISLTPVPRRSRYDYAPARPRDAAAALIQAADDKWGACVCIEVTGTRAAKIKADRGRKGTHDKVFVFFGTASC